MYRLSKDAFKTIAGKANFKDAYLSSVDRKLREDGFMLLDMRNEYKKIGVLSMSTVMKKFQELSNELIKENEHQFNEDNW